MRDNNIQNKYKNFTQFIQLTSSSELNYFILDSKFKDSFNIRMKKLIRDLEGNKDQDELKVIFNTHGEVAIIDSSILGAFISDVFRMAMEAKYKGVKIEKIVKDTIDSGEEVKKSFLKVAYRSMYETLNSIYKDITYKKLNLQNNKAYFGIKNYNKEDASLVIIALMILEDISKYIGLEAKTFTNLIKDIIQ